MYSLRRIAAAVGLALPLSLAVLTATPAWAGTAPAHGPAVGAVRPAACPFSMTWDGVKCS
ncbi:hypothetical protein [Streptacidiphilus monticola]|uniref:Leucine-rich repeat-containing N-terminal plant-type domain-containing protein n=1 Tax=Streptacidiphilus monticola TaxID=2161674 RepID=A0ABW1G3L4_9ACTN